MCTVTYIPKGADHFILTSNRDESAQRASSAPQFYVTEKQQLVFPVDPKSGGSWIGVAPSNRTACLLNGAFEKHPHKPPYRRSRGLVLLDSFAYAQAEQFADQYEFSGIEPFTLILCRPSKLHELRWDGQQVHLNHLEVAQAHIWSSSTLYDQHIRDRRAQWFNQWLQQTNQQDLHNIMAFHRFGGEQDQTNGLVMNRNNKVQTLSITAIHKRTTEISMHHLDLASEHQTDHTIAIKHEFVETH